MSKWRIAVFEFLAVPGILWLKLAALCVGFRWVMLRQEDEEEVDPPNYGHVPDEITGRKKDGTGSK